MALPYTVGSVIFQRDRTRPLSRAGRTNIVIRCTVCGAQRRGWLPDSKLDSRPHYLHYTNMMTQAYCNERGHRGKIWTA